MSTGSQPIALRPSTQDYQMQDAQGSFSASPFNPASYTRQFIGSPISWRASSYGMSGIASGPISSSWNQRFPVGSPTHRLFTTWEAAKSPNSLDADRDSILNALNVFDREGELCRNYNCCGIHLDDLHALLEHFEEVHIIVVDRDAPNAQALIQKPFNPQVNELTPQQAAQLRQRRQQQQQLFNQPRHPQPNASFDPDDMELELDLDNTPQPLPPCPPPSAAQSTASSHSSPSSGAPSPPDTPISTPLSAYPSPHAFVPSHLPNSHLSPYISQPSSPLSGTAASTRQSSPTGTSSSNPNLRPNLNVNLAYHPRSHLSSPAILANPEDAFNTYARFSSDYSSGLPGAQYNGASVDEASALTWQQVQALQQVQQQTQQQQAQQAQMQQQMNGCLPPALLFAPSASCTPAGTPGGSRVPSPTLQNPAQQGSANGSSPSAANKSPAAAQTTSPQRASTTGAAANQHQQGHSAQNSAAHGAASSSSSSHSSTNGSTPASLLRPASSLLLSKPFRCPKPNCNKSYKQANGLKYHMTHGSCNFAPPKDLEHVKDLLERKRRERDAQAIANGGTPLSRSMSVGSNGSSHPNGAGGSSGSGNPAHIGGLPTTLDTALLNSYYDLNLQSMNITETELREVEREAEKRLRPFACGVGDCQRRYKNMNGLRYHYQHSGEHGAVGLALLASGQHECLQNNHGGKRREQQQQHNTSNTNSTTASSSGVNVGSGSNAHHHHAAGSSSSSSNSNTTSGFSNASAPSSAGYATTTFAMDEEREGRSRTQHQHTRYGSSTFANLKNTSVAGSASVPVSRAASTSRTGTPVPVSVPVSANTSPKSLAATATSPTMNASSSSLSGALGNTTIGGAGPTQTSAMTTPIQVVPVHAASMGGIQQVNGVGINTGLPPLPPSSSASASAVRAMGSASPQQVGATSPSQAHMHAGAGGAVPTQQQMQQMAAAAYQQYAQQFQRQYQAAMQMHVQQQQQAAAQQAQVQAQQQAGLQSPTLQQQGVYRQGGVGQGDWEMS